MTSFCKQYSDGDNINILLFIVIQFLAHAKDFVEDLPSFEMLSHLELDIVTGEILLALLQKTPSLKTLVLKVSNLLIEAQVLFKFLQKLILLIIFV